MIQIPDVTLLALSSIEIPATIAALQFSSRDIDFGAIKLISDVEPDNLPENIIWEYCPKINNIMDFNHYMFSEMGKHVQTSHMLYVQHHALIIRPNLWNDEWLGNDYGGAPWMIKDDAYICHATGEHVRVGNGGFSLRSKRLLEIPNKYNLPLLQEQGWHNEDGNIVNYNRVKMLELGIKYMPLEQAVIFSYENEVPENQGIETFGFHRNLRIKDREYIKEEIREWYNDNRPA